LSDPLDDFDAPPLVDPNAWGTPNWLVEIARRAMGGIDLDPCTSEADQAIIRASTYYTGTQAGGTDGLVAPWHGRIWLNPPYGRGQIGPWVDRAMWALDHEEIDSMLVLVNTSSSTKWYHKLLRKCDTVALLNSRLRFRHPLTGEECAGNRYDQSMFLFANSQPEATIRSLETCLRGKAATLIPAP